jgi:hypothetical protein
MLWNQITTMLQKRNEHNVEIITEIVAEFSAAFWTEILGVGYCGVSIECEVCTLIHKLFYAGTA